VSPGSGQVTQSTMAIASAAVRAIAGLVQAPL
jgi:hypothetical protein